MPSAFVAPPARTPANLFRLEDLEQQRAFFAARPHLAPTPLRRCAHLARHLGVGELLVKDETSRFGLNAFKAAGAMFAVTTLMQRGEIKRGDTLVCASEGNHGRAIARAARDANCVARVYVSEQVAEARVSAIQAEGATVVRVSGTYDDAVRQMAREAESHGWVILSDTSWPGYTEIPWLIMLGYTRIMDESQQQAGVEPLLAAEFGTDGQRGASGRPQRPPFDAVFVPAGVGGLLAAVACWCDLEFGSDRPSIVAVEPLSAACVQASVRAGAPTSLPGPFDTTMGGLRCGEMSPAVFPAVAGLVDAFVGIEDAFAFEAMRLLARPVPPDPVIECGSSGAAALGGLLATLAEAELGAVKERLRLTGSSRVVVLASEGVTDPTVFRSALARH